jgi:hypothetical protein
VGVQTDFVERQTVLCTDSDRCELHAVAPISNAG